MKINQIIESTVTGSIAPVVMSMNGGKAHTRTKESVNVRGLQPAEKVIKGKAKKKGPYANSIIEEGKMKELDMDLKQLSDVAFKKKYKKTKQEVKDSLKEGKNKKGASPTKPVKEAHIEENDLIIIPGQGRTQRTGFVKHDPDRAEHEGETLKNSLHTISRAASVLDKHLSTQDHFPEWVSEKIGAIKGMMTSVMDYMISKKEMERDPDAMEGKFAKQRPVTGGVVAGGITNENETDYRKLVDAQIKRDLEQEDFLRYFPEQNLQRDIPRYIAIYKEIMDRFGNNTVGGEQYARQVITQLLKSNNNVMFDRVGQLLYRIANAAERSASIADPDAWWKKGLPNQPNPQRRKTDEMSEGKKVDRFVKHVEKSEEKAGKSKKEAENIAWATANKKGMLDNKNKKKKAK